MNSIPLGLAIRDRLPEHLEDAGYQCRTRKTEGRERSGALRIALQQALQDYLAEPSLESLAEANELIIALAEQDGFNAEALEKARKKALENEGSFSQGLILEALVPRPDFVEEH
jgi:predicted house-cleaning noncanonical NTP pyrophosphatase (MazG superfamily)